MTNTPGDTPKVGHVSKMQPWGSQGHSLASFEVDIRPVSTNSAYRVVRFGKRAGMTLSPEGRAFKTAITIKAIEAWRLADRPVCNSVFVILDIYWPTLRGDIDGPVKLILDAMQNTFYVNDRAVTGLLLNRRLDRDRPRIEITIGQLDDA